MSAPLAQSMPRLADYILGDQQPRQIAQPNTLTELAAVIAGAARDRLAVVPWGAGTRQFIAAPPSRYDLALDLRRLNRLIEYHPADLVVAVEAGMTLGEVQATLAGHGQWLPWDPPVPPTATIGGLLASAAWGPLRLGYGGPREWLLGMQVALGDGRLAQSGGKVVKNVAGYDTHKLHLGACGTLGVIGSAIFKVAPLPEQMQSLRATFAALTMALRAATALRQPPLQPVALTITDGEPVTFTVRFAGVAAAVQRQLELAVNVCHAADDCQLVADDQSLWMAADYQPTASDLLLRIGVPDSQLEPALDHLCVDGNQQLAIYPGLGLIQMRCPLAGADRLPALRQQIARFGGYVAVESGPPGIDRWGAPPAALPLMRALRQRWDPAGILNPGRLPVDGNA